MQIKATVSYRCTRNGTAVIQTTRCGEVRAPATPRARMQNAATVKTGWQFLKRLNTALPHDPAIPLLVPV